jgi:multiple sugar transport system substrate-binding protein
MSENRSYKLTRREMLKLTAFGAAGLAVGIETDSVFANAPARDVVKIRVQADPQYEQPVADLLKSNNPNIDVEFLTVTGIDHEEVASKILAMVAAGESIDVGYAATEATQLYAGQQLAAPLKDRVLADETFMQDLFSDMAPSLVEAMMYEGDLYELPRDFNAANMYFNMGLLQENGIELPADNWTKDDFYNVAKATTQKNSAGETEIFGFGWTNRLWGSWMPWIFVAGGNLFTEDRAPGGEWLWDKFYANDPAAQGRGGGLRWITPVANSPEVVEALEFVVQLWKEGLTPAVEMGTGETLSGFYATGKLCMTPAGGFWAGWLHNNGMGPADFDVQLWPAWRNQKHQFGTGGKWLASFSKHPDEAWEYIKTEVSPEGFSVSAYFNPYIFTTPTRRSFCNAKAFAETGPAHWNVFYDTLDKHPDTAPIPAPPWSVAETSIFTRYTGVAMTGEMAPQEALDKMQGELVDLVNRQPQYYKD